MASVRYIANDIDKSVDFYRDRLGFAVEKHNPGKFAELTLDDLHLFLNAPGAGSAGKAGGVPQPGGWSRFMIVTLIQGATWTAAARRPRPELSRPAKRIRLE
jgi:catechol 2,3-dioxygenase-like lactoylglutathione lyase family enzyme